MFRFWDIKRLVLFRTASDINVFEVVIEIIAICLRAIVFLAGTLTFYIPGILLFKMTDYLFGNKLLGALFFGLSVLFSIAFFFFLEGAMCNKKKLYQNDYALKNFNFLFKLIGPFLGSIMGVLFINKHFQIPILGLLILFTISTILLTGLSIRVLKPVKRVDKYYLKPFFEYGKTF